MGLGKFGVLGLSAAAATAFLVSCDGTGGGQNAAKVAFDPENEVHQTSYAMGRSIGNDIKRMEVEADLEVLISALREVFDETPAQLPDSALAAIDARTQQQVRERARQKRQKIEEDALAASREFLEKNKANEGVVVTESGLQYIVMKAGTGPKPKETDMVKVHYHGTLPDGTVFDSSVDRGEPVTFAVTGVIRGWTEALKLMPVGSKYKLFVPPELAYGRRGARAPIGPNAALVFEVELLSIEKK